MKLLFIALEQSLNRQRVGPNPNDGKCYYGSTHLQLR